MAELNKILIVEDEGVIAEHLKIILNSLGFENIEIANDKARALEFIKSLNPNLVLLDIRMESELDGIEIAKIINEHHKIPFLFITSHSDSQIIDKAIETNPTAYITKPFKKTDIQAAISIALKNKKNTQSDTLIIKDGYDDIKIDLESILYVQSDRNYIDIYCENRKYNTRNSLEWFSQNVSEEQFMRIHRSYVINIKKLERLTSNEVIIGNSIIPISRKYLHELREKIKKN